MFWRLSEDRNAYIQLLPGRRCRREDRKSADFIVDALSVFIEEHLSNSQFLLEDILIITGQVRTVVSEEASQVESLLKICQTSRIQYDLPLIVDYQRILTRSVSSEHHSHLLFSASHNKIKALPFLFFSPFYISSFRLSSLSTPQTAKDQENTDK